MKNVFCLFVLLSICVFAQAQDKKDAPVSNTERIIDKYLDKTGDMINNLAARLKVPSEKVYSVLITQQRVQAISWIIITCILFVLTLIAFFILRHQHDFSKEWYMQDTEAYWTFALLSCIAFVAVLIVSVALVPGKLINPDYYAIKEIMNALK